MPSETNPVDPVFPPKNWDCGTWVAKGVRASAGGSWSEWKGCHSPAEKELLVAAAVEPAGKGSPGLAPRLVLSLAVLRSCLGRHPETCHTASESATETAAAENSPKPAAAESAAFESAAGAGCAAAAAVWPLSCQTEEVSYSSLWLQDASLPLPAGQPRLGGTAAVAVAEEQVLHKASPQLQSHCWASPAQGPPWAPAGTVESLAGAESQQAQRKSL